MTIDRNDPRSQQPVDLSDQSALDRVLTACEVELSNEHRKQLRRFALEYDEINDGKVPTFAELVTFARPRLLPSEG
ncbi:hypothetical protein [Zymobacter sp. IVIA_12111.31 C1]|uniref:hypothetical protein n=1 Tax=Zymobacter sp. IVIA_12111.31 C1 TaxID=3394854 RepID=UPI0039C29025